MAGRPGPHTIAVAIGDGADPAVFEFRDERRRDCARGRRQVVQFDRHAGFHWQ